MNTFSKIYEQVIKEQIVLGTERFLLTKILAYRKSYSTQHVITSITEEWRKKLDKNFLVAALFDRIPHNFLIAKLAAYVSDLRALALIFEYLENQKQSVRINNTHNSFENMISVVPQGSVLAPILFSLSISDFL